MSKPRAFGLFQLVWHFLKRFGIFLEVVWHFLFTWTWKPCPWRDRQAGLGKLAMKMCGLQQDFVTGKIYQEVSADMQGQQITSKTKSL